MESRASSAYGVLIAADHRRGRTSRRRSGSRPASRRDPLGDYLGALDRTIELDPEIALPGHGQPIPLAGRALCSSRSTTACPLEEAVTALTDEPQTGYQLSFSLFGRELGAAGRRFAIAQMLSGTTSGSSMRAQPVAASSTGRLPILPPDHRGRRNPAENPGAPDWA